MSRRPTAANTPPEHWSRRPPTALTPPGTTDKQGCKLVRWAAIEAISHNHSGGKIKADYRRIAERRGRNIGRVAAARKVLRLVYYGLRDGEIRCLTPVQAG